MVYYLMDCYHLGKLNLETNEIKCPYCGTERIKERIGSVTWNLNGRYAMCGNKKVKSRWDLPNFVYQPEKDYDLFMAGAKNRINNSKGLNKITTEQIKTGNITNETKEMLQLYKEMKKLKKGENND